RAPVARMALGGSATAPRSPSLFRMPSSSRSGSPLSRCARSLHPSNRRVRTRMHGGVGGGGREADPYPDYQDQRRLPLMREQPTLAGVALSRMPQSRRVEETAVSNSIPRTQSSPKRSGAASGP